MSNDTTKRLNSTCMEIARMLESAHDGELFEDGNGDLVFAAEEPEGCEPVDVSGYLDRAAFVEAATLTVDMSRRLQSVRVPVCLGGPNVYIDTDEMAVTGYWGSDAARVAIPYEVCADVDECIESLAGMAW